MTCSLGASCTQHAMARCANRHYYSGQSSLSLAFAGVDWQSVRDCSGTFLSNQLARPLHAGMGEPLRMCRFTLAILMTCYFCCIGTSSVAHLIWLGNDLKSFCTDSMHVQNFRGISVQAFLDKIAPHVKPTKLQDFTQNKLNSTQVGFS